MSLLAGRPLSCGAIFLNVLRSIGAMSRLREPYPSFVCCGCSTIEFSGLGPATKRGHFSCTAAIRSDSLQSLVSATTLAAVEEPLAESQLTPSASKTISVIPL